MRKKSGFILIETIVVITILSVGLISLYASYNLILTKAVSKSYYDNVDYVYKTYMVANYLIETNQTTFTGNYKVVNITANSDLNSIATNLGIEKIYIVKGTYSAITTPANLLQLDGSSIEYIKSMTGYEETKNNYIVKFVEPGIDPVLKVINFASLAL